MIDLRSDTATRPTAGMRARSPRPTSATSRGARTRPSSSCRSGAGALLGQEAAVFLPTATMANQIALKLHRGPVTSSSRRSTPTSSSTSTAAPPSTRGSWSRRSPGTPGGSRVGAAARRRRRRARRPPTSARPCSRSRTRTTPRADAVWPLDELDDVVTGLRASSGSRPTSTARASSTPRSRSASSRRRSRRASTPSRSACRRGSAARSVRLLAGSSETDRARVAREASVRRRDAPGGHRRRRRRVRARPPRRAARRRPRARHGGSPRRWHAAGLPVDLDQVETNFVQIDVGRARARAGRGARPASEAGVGLSATIHPTVLRAVTHLDIADADIETRDRARSPRAAGGPCRRLRIADRLDRLRATAQARAARALGQRRRLPRRRRRLARARRARRRRGRPGGDAGHAVPHRLDHEDLHRRRRSCSSASAGASTSTPGRRILPELPTGPTVSRTRSRT